MRCPASRSKIYAAKILMLNCIFKAAIGICFPTREEKLLNENPEEFQLAQAREAKLKKSFSLRKSTVRMTKMPSRTLPKRKEQSSCSEESDSEEDEDDTDYSEEDSDDDDSQDTASSQASSVRNKMDAVAKHYFNINPGSNIFHYWTISA